MCSPLEAARQFFQFITEEQLRQWQVLFKSSVHFWVWLPYFLKVSRFLIVFEGLHQNSEVDFTIQVRQPRHQLGYLLLLLALLQLLDLGPRKHQRPFHHLLH